MKMKSRTWKVKSKKQAVYPLPGGAAETQTIKMMKRGGLLNRITER
jgi:hypothetical protein